MKEQKDIRHRYALLIGVANYIDPLFKKQPLPQTTHDVIGLEKTLSKYGYTVRTLHERRGKPGEKPTRANIWAELKSITSMTGPGDLLIIHYGGHGALDKNKEAYLVPADGRQSALKETAIYIEEFKQEIINSKAQAKILFLDACCAGIGRASGAMSEEFERHVFLEAKGTATFAACRHHQKAYNHDSSPNGVFTYYILEALNGAAVRKSQRFITFNDLNDFVTSSVKSWAIRQGLRQNPNADIRLEGDPPLVEIPEKPRKKPFTQGIQPFKGILVLISFLLLSLLLYFSLGQKAPPPKEQPPLQAIYSDSEITALPPPPYTGSPPAKTGTEKANDSPTSEKTPPIAPDKGKKVEEPDEEIKPPVVVQCWNYNMEAIPSSLTVNMAPHSQPTAAACEIQLQIITGAADFKKYLPTPRKTIEPTLVEGTLQEKMGKFKLILPDNNFRELCSGGSSTSSHTTPPMFLMLRSRKERVQYENRITASVNLEEALPRLADALVTAIERKVTTCSENEWRQYTGNRDKLRLLFLYNRGPSVALDEFSAPIRSELYPLLTTAVKNAVDNNFFLRTRLEILPLEYKKVLRAEHNSTFRPHMSTFNEADAVYEILMSEDRKSRSLHIGGKIIIADTGEVLAFSEPFKVPAPLFFEKYLPDAAAQKGHGKLTIPPGSPEKLEVSRILYAPAGRPSREHIEITERDTIEKKGRLWFEIVLPKSRGYLLVYLDDGIYTYNLFPGTHNAVTNRDYVVADKSYPMNNTGPADNLSMPYTDIERVASSNIINQSIPPGKILIGGYRLTSSGDTQAFYFFFSDAPIASIEKLIKNAHCHAGKDINPKENQGVTDGVEAIPAHPGIKSFSKLYFRKISLQKEK